MATMTAITIICDTLLGNTRAPGESTRAIQKIGASKAVQYVNSIP